VPFEYVTLDNVFREVYVEGDKTAEMTGALGILAILLSCMGLFGLSSFAVERRIKEIGIRKVLGASATGIIQMLIKDFIKWVLIANIIAMPLAYLLMNRIGRFFYAYPMNIGPGIFMLTLLITVFIAFITVTSQTFRAAQANPAETLKYE
jgi:putative ABC transport system permease protein